MNLIFEDRTTYDPALDPVMRATVVVECNPGQADSLLQYARAVCVQAGVYSVYVETELVAPPKPAEPEPVAAAADAYAVAAAEQIAPPALTAAPAEPQPAPTAVEGVADAEQQLQPTSGDVAEGASVGSEPGAVVGQDAGSVADQDSSVAGPAGEGGTGSVGGSEEGGALPGEEGPVAEQSAAEEPQLAVDSGAREGTGGDNPIVPTEGA